MPGFVVAGRLELNAPGAMITHVAAVSRAILYALHQKTPPLQRFILPTALHAIVGEDCAGRQRMREKINTWEEGCAAAIIKISKGTELSPANFAGVAIRCEFSDALLPLFSRWEILSLC